MNKLYGYLSGRCSKHGARTKPVKGWPHDSICEVTAECKHKRKNRFFKIYIRRKARRFYDKSIYSKED